MKLYIQSMYQVDGKVEIDFVPYDISDEEMKKLVKIYKNRDAIDVRVI